MPLTIAVDTHVHLHDEPQAADALKDASDRMSRLVPSAGGAAFLLARRRLRRWALL